MSNESRFQVFGAAPENYDKYVSMFMSPFVDALVERAHLQEGDAVLDVACGTGFVARRAASSVRAGGRVVGLDLNSGMLELAQKVSVGVEPTIEWCEASAEDIPLDDADFDAVLCSLGIMFFPDLAKGITEMCRVLAPYGKLVSCFWAGPLEKSPYIAAHVNKLVNYIPEILELLDQAFRLDREEVANLYRASGLSSVTAETIEILITLPPIADYLPGHMAALPIADQFNALESDRLDQLYEDITTELAQYVQTDGTINVPFVLHMVSGTKSA
jgi:ubiquinone/menaquinone biosynthesis C-methylase UbiE